MPSKSVPAAQDLLCQRPGEAVLADQLVAVHRVEIELGRANHEVVVEVVGVRHALEQASAFVEGYFDLAAVAQARPGFGLLGSELYRDAVVLRRLRSGLRDRDDAAIVARREREPGPHLVCPPGDFGVVGLGGDGECGPSRRLSRIPLPGVVLDAADQQGEPAGEGENLPVLRERQALRDVLGSATVSGGG